MTALLASVAILASRTPSPALACSSVLVAGLYAVGPLPIAGLWPLAGLLALAIAAVYALSRGELRAWRSWLRIGRLRWDTWLWLFCMIAVTAFALLLWSNLTGGSLPPAYREAARSVSPEAAAAGGLIFLVLNGLVEDAVFFGVVLTAALTHLPPRTAIVVTSIAFGIGHFAGVPGGYIGVVMAAVWAILLAALRVRTGGMLATYLAHVAADATIVAILLPRAIG
ncbi:CPBP family intramembrane metalloprotease [Leifsonia shinshuensis]|uniref:CPBP family intramembrane glutamic endopeptidase n=1 Tax=Leifsonia shinshuensis TaxID=150026 RepID=UPI001F512252|nr:CPBP family intramembrane glutamic endopeptidase [Leifsonia shinshuensis]MCI0158112.1 CPBP family intramembrane metalloprotease [Leifsonia shinshuensis]